MKFIITYYETRYENYVIEADNKDEAEEIFQDKMYGDELEPPDRFLEDGWEVRTA